jgi:hypothetical protein
MVEYIPATTGLFVFARIADLKSLDEDKQLTTDLQAYGLSFSPGWLYNENCEEFGWRRVTIAVSHEIALNAISRLRRYKIDESRKR